AKIVVEPGKKLEITNGTKIFGCSELWESIEVQNGATLIIDNATIEDAYTAVHAYGGGNLFITNSTFNSNFVGILVDGPIPSYSENTTFNAFYGNTFYGGDELLPAPANLQTNFALPGIGDKAFTGVWIQTKANPLHSLDNVFNNLSNGIYANGTSLKITKTQFTNIWENGYDDWLSGYGIRAKDYTYSHNFQQTGFGKDAEPLSFSLCSKAMRLEGIRVDYVKDNNIRANKGIELVTNYPKAVVIDNRIESWITGIELSHVNNASDIWVSLNDIEVAGGIGIQSNMMNLGPVSEKGLNISLNNVILKAPKTRGIELNANNAAHIMENKVSANLGLSGFTGIRVNNDHSSALTCNEVTSPLPNYDKTFGIEIWDGYLTRQMCNGVSNTAKGVYFTMGSYAPERFQENTFEGNDIGLQLSTSAAIGPQTHRGNRWNGSFGSYGAQHQSSNQGDWFASRFIVNANVPGIFRPDLPTGQNPWFQYDPSGSPIEECQLINTCVTELPSFPVDGLYGIDTTIASGGFQTTDYVGVTNWLSRRYLYGKLTENPGLIAPGSVFESFYNATANSTVGSFAAIEAGMEAMYEVPAGTATQVLAHFDTLSLRLEEAGSIDSLLQAVGYDTLLMQQRAAVMQVLQNAESSLNTLMQPVLSQRISDASALASQNSTITADSIFELNERTVKDIYLNTLAVGITEFDETQLAVLESIAGQCPLTGGSAVFKARSLLAIVQDSVYDDEMLCEQIGERSESQMTIEHSGFALFPNPAQNKVTVAKPVTMEEDTEIFIFNSLGKLVLRKVFPSEIPSVTLNISALDEGTFIVSIYTNGRKIFADKLVIIR
ncbi:MAG: T9SS C-terminal target domain-containing protein, partial [Bacteroidetes bacterium]